MDISGVDVDALTDEEILDLCGDIVDMNNNEIEVLKNIDINKLSDDKVQELYEDIIEINNTHVAVNRIDNLTEWQILEINKHTVDMENEEILLLNGSNINLNDLSEDEILSLYNDTISKEKILISDAYTLAPYECYDFTMVSYSPRSVRFTCWVVGNKIQETRNIGLYIPAEYDTGGHWVPEDVANGYGTGYCKISCGYYLRGVGSCYSVIYKKTSYFDVNLYTCK